MFGSFMSDRGITDAINNFTSDLLQKGFERQQMNDIADQLERKHNNDDDDESDRYSYNTEEELDEYHRRHRYTSEEEQEQDEKGSQTADALAAPSPQVVNGSAATSRGRGRKRKQPTSTEVRPPSRVEINSRHDNDGVYNNSQQQQPQQQQQQSQAQAQQVPQEEPKMIAFDPFEEDFSMYNIQDRKDGVDFDYCFLCEYSQTPQDRDKNPHYMSLLKIFYENYGKCKLVHLCERIRTIYNERIRKRKPEKYHKWALITIHNHFHQHIKSPEIFKMHSIRVLDKVKNMIEKQGLFIYPENNPGQVTFDPKQFANWVKVEGLLNSAYGLAKGARSRASRILA